MQESVSIDQAFLDRVQMAIEKNFSDQNFGVEELALEVGISRAHLYRKLQNLTGQSAHQMIKEFRLKKALDLLQKKVGSVSEIAYRVGFSSPSYFNTCFSEYFGYPPGKVKPSPSAGIPNKFTLSRKELQTAILAGGLVTLVLILYLVYLPRSESSGETGRFLGPNISIAVLPFISQSNDKDNQYLTDAMMGEIILHLSYNKEMRVMPRISVEKYRNSEKNIAKIARELDVKYILTGSFQKQGKHARIIVSLINARTNEILWTEDYYQNWTDIFSVQRQIAQNIARELDIEISPEVKQIMENIPTTSPDAAAYYWRGENEFIKYILKPNDREALESAENLFYKAIGNDPTYARAYVGLAHVYWRKHYWDTFLSEDFADSALILADKALTFDNQLAEAYCLRGSIFLKRNNREQALNEFNKAIRLNPSSAGAYRSKGNLYHHLDLVKSIENYTIAASLDRGGWLPWILTRLGWNYAYAGFKEIACDYVEDAFELDNDSAAYYQALSEIEHCFGDFKKAIELGKKSNAIDSSDWFVNFYIGLNYSFLDNSNEAFEWYKRYENIQFTSEEANSYGAFLGAFRLGHAYLSHGFEKEANYYTKKGLELYERLLELNRHYHIDISTFYYMAAQFAVQDDKEKAFEYLSEVNNRQGMPIWMIECLDHDPMFDSLRDEPEFKQIVRDVEAKYQAEHERVRQWLEENEIL